jgi:uncharacterized protein YbjT (DUF2867 family)
MKIVVIGGSGLIGTRVVQKLRAAGHQAVPASPSSGVNVLTGAGLAEALKGAEVLVDVTNSPSFEAKAVMDFFRTSGRNLAAAAAVAGVKHHVALSIVGTDRPPGNAYFHAKAAQERIIQASGISFTIVRATQFFEFLGAIADLGTVGGEVRLSPALFQPIAAEDVAEAVADAAMSPAANGMIETAGPERLPLDEFVARFLRARKDSRNVVADVRVGYFGGQIDDRSLVPEGDLARIGRVRFDEWIRRLTV